MSDLMIIIGIFVFSICLTEFLRRVECSCPCARGMIQQHEYIFHFWRYNKFGDGEGVLTLSKRCKTCGDEQRRTYYTRKDGMKILTKYFRLDTSILYNVYEHLIDEKVGHDLSYDYINGIIKKVVKA